MIILRGQNKITDFVMILAWACPFNNPRYFIIITYMYIKTVSERLANQVLPQLSVYRPLIVYIYPAWGRIPVTIYGVPHRRFLEYSQIFPHLCFFFRK